VTSRERVEPGGAVPTTAPGSATEDGATSSLGASNDAPDERHRVGNVPHAPDSRAVALVGPTAVGKTAVALRLAERFAIEVVSLDSRQMVRRLDAGTAKPTAAERARVVHHLVDIAEPDAPLSLADVQPLALSTIADILARGRLPLVVGGTGQYVRAVIEGWSIPRAAPDAALRARLGEIAEAAGPAALHEQLAAVDPAAAARIDPRNVRRVVRALEVHALTGRPISEVQARAGSRYRWLVLGLGRPREDLYARVDRRIDAMLAGGLEEEVRGLVSAGYGFDLPAMSSVGYREWRGCFAGDIDRDEVVRLIRHDTRRLVRQQATWFRADDRAIHWFDVTVEDDAVERIAALVRRFVGGEAPGG